MPKYHSKYWSLSYDICTKHHRPLPCTECIKTGDKDLEIIDDLAEVQSRTSDALSGEISQK